MLGRRRAAVAAAFLVALFVVPISGSADPIEMTVTGRAELLRNDNSDIDLLGTDGFTFKSPHIFWTLGFVNPIEPGETGRVDAEASGIDLGGAVTFRGVSYTLGTADGPSAIIAFSSSEFVAPPTRGVPAFLKTPFTFDGRFSAGGDGPFVHFGGSGSATIQFDPAYPGSPEFPLWEVHRAAFDFTSAVAPTPEPAAILLLGTAVAGLAAARRRRQ